MLIVDMPMPKNCCECDLRQDDFDRGEQYCPFTGVECLSIGRQAKCPIKGELVTCGECKHGVPDTNCIGEKAIRCECDGNPYGGGIWLMNPNWYCADGERKEQTHE